MNEVLLIAAAHSIAVIPLLVNTSHSGLRPPRSIGTDLRRFSLIPIMLPGATMRPYPVPARQAGNFVTLLTQWSKKYGTGFSAEGDELAIRAP